MIQTLITAATHTRACAEIALATGEVYAAIKDEDLSRNERISKILTSSFFIGAKTFQLTIAYNGEASPSWGAAATTFGELASASRDTHQFFFSDQEEQSNILNFSANLLMRITTVTNVAIVLIPEVFGPFLPLISRVSPPLQAGAFLVLNRELIGRSASKAWSAIINIISSDELPPGSVEIRVQEATNPVLMMSESFAQHIDEIRGLEEASQLPVIPYLFLKDSVLIQNRCTISNNPIRFILAISNPNVLGRELIFERDAILGLLANGSSPPQGWLEGVPFERQSLHELPIIQQQIDDRLTYLLESFKELLIEYLPTYSQEIEPPPLIALAQQLRLTNKTDTEIADLLMSNKQVHGILSSVKVNTLQHTFNNSYLTQATWLIECSLVHWIRPGKYPSDLEKAARAILGSHENEDLDALKIVAKNGHAIKIYLAQNLGRCEISVYSLKDFTASLTEKLKVLPEAHVADKISSNIWIHPFVSSIKVLTVNYRFKKTRSPIKARMIEVHLCQTTNLKSPLDSSIAKAACRALLGSLASEDLNALKVAAKIRDILRIFFSLKDRKYEIQ